eukprot:2313553-Karenia_brevis.AAC.1
MRKDLSSVHRTLQRSTSGIYREAAARFCAMCDKRVEDDNATWMCPHCAPPKEMIPGPSSGAQQAQ